MSNTCKKFQNPKIARKWLSIGPPSTFFTQNFFYQNDSEWPKMDFKHNFKNREIFYFLLFNPRGNAERVIVNK